MPLSPWTRLLPGGALQQRPMLTIESGGAEFNPDRVGFQKCRQEYAGGQIRAGERGVALVAIVEHGFVVFR